MSFGIRRADYFHVTIEDQLGKAYELLSELANISINLLAFAGIPLGSDRTQLSIFPEDARKMEEAARRIGLDLDGPHSAILVQGDDELGALAGIHEKLSNAGVDVYTSNGVSDGRGGYGYLLYVRPNEIDKAERALEI